MEPTIRVAQFINITTPANSESPSKSYSYQNYFFGIGDVAIPGTAGPLYTYAPFELRGSLSSVGGDNPAMQLLLPHSYFAVALVEDGNGNRLSKLTVKTVWMANSGDLTNYASYSKTGAETNEYYVGIGASFNDTTIELRFRSAMDSVGANFPAQRFNNRNVGLLPLSSNVMVG